MTAPYDLTDLEIKGVIETSLDTTLFSGIAASFISENLASKGFTDARLHQITLYFAAHLVCLSEERGGLRRSRTGESDESYKAPGDKDTGLKSTRFGQMCLILDTSGTLAAISTNTGLKASFEIVTATYDRPVTAPWFL